MPSKVPPLLEPHVPGAVDRDGSLTVLTSVQGATTNWLVLRYLVTLLQQQDTSVVLISFLRDFSFWKEGATRLGLDLESHRQHGRLSFVDGVTGMFTPTDGQQSKDRVLRSGKVEDVKGQVEGALADLKTEKKVLVMDQVDALLAMGVTDALSLQNALLALREVAHSTVLTLAVDVPLIQNQNTTLEREHASLVLGETHVADEVISLRKLDTGAAADVSGVLRVSGRDNVELLYHVAGDGNVKVFERGT